jgi:tetratricopeptide (TPR) repeat protein
VAEQGAQAGSAKDDAAAVWEEDVVIPTYQVGEPDPNPMFLEKRVYQGSSGAVFPLPVIDRLSDEKTDRKYRAVFLENEYLKIMILPELGGRVQMAYAKTLDYHFVYYNRVIKPALVGLAGPWIAGGIELNWPQHHRPSTFLPVDYVIEKADDGRATVCLGEIDRMHGTKSLARLSLYPGKAFLEISVRLWNPTLLPQTFLWWANPAVHANDQYQSVFPPDVHAVFDHGKREVSRFPVATGTYYRVDYSAGVDISWYRNIPVPTSYMAYHSDYDFVGGYDHGRKAGILHVADHHVSPGKKLWTWGNGDFAKAWERNLTDNDGPYIELMTGVFTDNQPDFSWLEPGEEKSFTQSFLPYSGIGMVKNASRDASIALDRSGGAATVGVYSTSRRAWRVVLTAMPEAAGSEAAGSRAARPVTVCLDTVVEIKPESPFITSVPVPPSTPQSALSLSVRSVDGEVVLSCSPREETAGQIPEPARPAPLPSEVKTQEELSLIGLHLEQYRHATFRPDDYYAEALARDPGDSRCNLAMGLLFLRRGDCAGSEQYFRKSIERLCMKNPNPQTGAPHLYLGCSLELQDRVAEAEEAYFKSTWSADCRAAAFAGLARCAMRRGDFPAALQRANASLAANPRNPGVRCIRSMALRKLGMSSEALEETEAVLEEDPLSFLARHEKELAIRNVRGASAAPGENISAAPCHMGDAVLTSIAIAGAYVACGLFEEAAAVLRAAVPESPDRRVNPHLLFWLGYCHERMGNREEAMHWIRRADSLPQGSWFAAAIEAIPVLETAAELFPAGARASYHLGNLFYASRRVEKAVAEWERAKAVDPSFPTVRRNLALAAFNKQGDPERAQAELEQAFLLDPADARLLMELDLLLKKRGMSPDQRHARLRRHQDLVRQRDDLAVEWVSLLNLRGDYRGALGFMEKRIFHPWEGGEGKVTRQYTSALLGLSREALGRGEATASVELARRALQYPVNLGEGRLPGAIPNDVYYYLGCGQEAARDIAGSRDSLERASTGEKEPAISMYYNDQPADMIFFQGLAFARLGQDREARGRFDCLIEYAEGNRNRTVTIDYFAVSLPDMQIFDDDLSRRNRIFCTYIQALGWLGREDQEKAVGSLEEVLKEDPSHAGAADILRLIRSGWRF